MPSTIPGCYADIRKYEALSSSISSLVSLLDSNDKDFENLKKNIQDNYLVNGDVTPVYDKTNNLAVDVDKTSNYLKNTILPAISFAIKALYRRIAEIEAEEEEAERRKQEEASKANTKTPSKGFKSNTTRYVK